MNEEKFKERASFGESGCGEENAGPERQRRKSPRQPRKISAKYLERAALHYLERYAASSQQLRQVMRRRILKSSGFHGNTPDEGYELLEKLIERLTAAGLLNDRAYAAGRARNRHNRGQSGKAIAAYLKSKGVGDADVAYALESLREENAQPDLRAALTYCRKRRAGPYRSPDEREAFLNKDLAALARQGFSYDLARKIVESDLEELESEIPAKF